MGFWLSLTEAMTNKAWPKIRLLPYRERARVEERDRESIARIECKHRKSSDPPPSACSLTKQGHQRFGSTTQNKQS